MKMVKSLLLAGLLAVVPALGMSQGALAQDNAAAASTEATNATAESAAPEIGRAHV
jgi:cytochrome c oxidase subunit 2